MSSIININNVSKRYKLGGIIVEALRDVTLKVEKGEFVSILGPSGSGKSTLLSLIGALDKPSEGKIVIDGKDVTQLRSNQLADLRKKIGFVFQSYNLIPRLTALENVEMPMSINLVKTTERRRKAEELLKAVNLADRMNHKPTQLSGGQQQRVAIARALANNPLFLLLDEPTGNVDSKSSRDIMGLISELNKKNGITIIAVTHDENIAHHSKRTIKIIDGTIMSDIVTESKNLEI
jgi:putative ABC transport system ATP-binding protein